MTFLPVDGEGLVDPAGLAAAITPRTVLLSVMAANNETGALQPLGDLARIAREHGVVFHTDAAQAIGKIPFAATELDLVTVVGHKIYAPKGIGALCIRPGVTLEPLVYGGGQEHGLRAGTEIVARLPRWVGRGWARLLNAGTKPLDAVNFAGSWLGGSMMPRSAMVVLCGHAIAALHRRLDRENDSSLERGMPYPTRWDPFFREFMTVADLYRFPVQHFDFHREQLSLSRSDLT